MIIIDFSNYYKVILRNVLNPNISNLYVIRAQLVGSYLK